MNIKLVFTGAYWTILLGLCFVSLFLTKEVFLKYISFDSTFKSSEESLNDLPSIVICFSPSNNSFIFDERFTIHKANFMHLSPSVKEKYKLKLGDNPNFELHISELWTTYSGICYKITSTTSKVGKNDWHGFTLTFKPDIPSELLPVIVVHFTSEINSFGITRTFWIDGDVAILHVTPKHRFIEYGLREEHRSFLTEKSKCRNKPFYHCYGLELLNHNFSQCPRKCLSHSLPEHIQSKNKVPLCEIGSKEMLCARDVALEVRTAAMDSGKCVDKACNPRKYKGVITHEDTVGDPIHSRSFAYYFLPPVHITKYEEYIILDFFELLGSIGGSLGMLVGFSFLSVASFILEHLQSLVKFLSNRWNWLNHQ